MQPEPVAVTATTCLTNPPFFDQLFFVRPVRGWAKYRTPIKNLYLCAAGTHPGGGVMGASGRLAAMELLKDWRKGKI